MAWLKGTATFSHGDGQPEYFWLGNNPSEDAIDDMKIHVHNEIGDPDGYRVTKFEILEELPADLLAKKIKCAEAELRAAQNWLFELQAMVKL